MKYTAGICYGHINLFEKVVILAYICGSSYGKMDKAYACASATNTDNDCILFDISCNGQEHIFIKEALYGFREAQPKDCETTATECRHNRKGCCTDDNGDVTMPFAVEHRYNISKACSWKHQCKKQTPVGHLNETISRYSVLEYECQKDLQIVHFCKQERASGKTVDLILEGNHDLVNNSDSGAYRTECKCILETSGNEYQISAPDLRLQSESHGCNSETVISGLAITNITCNTSLISILPAQKIFSSNSSYHQIAVSFKFLPEFIWIKAEVTSDTTPVHATTRSTTPYATETSFSTSTAAANVTSESTVSNTTSIPKTTVSIANDSSTSFLTVSDTQPQSSSAQNNRTSHSSSTTAGVLTTTKRSKVLEVYSLDSNEAPIAAIVIPVILVLVGTGVCLFLWRKWRRRKDKLDEPSKVDDKEDAMAANKINDHKYHNTSDFKASDNYTVLGIENAYAYIDHGDIEKKSSAENQTDKNSENTYTYIDHADIPKQGAAERQITDPTENNYVYIDNEKVNSLFLTETIDTTCSTQNTVPYIDLQDVHIEAVATLNNSSYHSLKSDIGSGSSETDNVSKPCKIGVNKSNTSKQTQLRCDSHIYSALDIKEAPQRDDEDGVLPVQQYRQMIDKPSMLHAVYTEDHDYFKLESQDSSRAQTEKRIDNTNMHDKETDESQDYFLLEPENTNSSVCSNATNIKDRHEEEIINNHNYFVLELQSTSSSNNVYNVNVHKKEVNDNHNYSVMEPQDDNIRSNEIVGGVQTLPDNEYNVLSLKSERISHDPNYGTMKSGQPENIKDDSADYSHLDKTTVREQY